MGKDKRRRGRNLGPALNSRNARIGSQVRCTSTVSMQGQHGVILTLSGNDAEVEFQSGHRTTMPMRRFQLIVGVDPTIEVKTSSANRFYVPLIPSDAEMEKSKAVGFECRTCGLQMDGRLDATRHVQAGCFGMGAAKQQLIDDADRGLVKAFVAAGGDTAALKSLDPEQIQKWLDDDEKEKNPGRFLGREDATWNF